MNLRGQADRNGINTKTWKFLEIFKHLGHPKSSKKLLAHVKKYLDFALLNRVIWHVDFFSSTHAGHIWDLIYGNFEKIAENMIA